MNNPVQLHRRYESLMICFFIAGIILISRLAFYQPVLYSDDWTQIVGNYANGTLPWVDWSARRPLHLTPIYIIAAFFGLNVHAYYMVLVLLQILCGIFVFIILRWTFPQQSPVPLLATLLIIVYPVDYTHMWLTMISVYWAWLLCLVYAWLLTQYVDSGKTLYVLLGLLCLSISLLAYEGPLGIAVLWGIFLAIRTRQTWRIRLWLFTPLGLAFAFSVSRLVLQPKLGVVDDYVQGVSYSPVMLVSRLASGAKVFVWAWLELFDTALPGGKDFDFGDKLWVIIVLSSLIVLLWLGLATGLRRRICKGDGVIPPETLWPTARQKTTWILIGMLFFVAGYFPLVLLYLPSLISGSSRMNFFAAPGASVAILAFIYLAATLVARCRQQVNYLVLTAVGPLLVIGVVTLMLVQRDIGQAWNEQKRLWSDLLSLCPALADDSQVYFLLSGFDDRFQFATWQRTPLLASWEVTSALQVLYGNRSLAGAVIVPNPPSWLRQPELQFDRVVDSEVGKELRYEDTLFLAFDRHQRHLRLVTDLAKELSVPAKPGLYRPNRCLPGGQRYVTDEISKFISGVGIAPAVESD